MVRLLCVGILVISLACGGREDARPDIVLVTFDTLRADHCSSYGYQRTTTPSLDGLAATGVRFAVAYAPTATTAPSLASLFTGRDPLAHRVRRNGIPLSAEARTLAETLTERGYLTAGFPSSFVVNGKFGFGQGFGVYDDDFSDPSKPARRGYEWLGEVVPGSVFMRSAPETTRRALAWLDGLPSERSPFFLWIHYIDPHEPYRVPPELGDPFGAETHPQASLEQIRARYDTLIRSADAELGRVIERASELAGSNGLLSVVTADHGEAFLEHGWRSHGVQIYEESVRIPMVVQWPGRVEPAVIHRAVSLHDVLPTLFGLLGDFPADEHTAGRDLSGLLLKTQRDLSPTAVMLQRQTYESDGLVEPIPLPELGGKVFGAGVEVRGEMFAIREGRWKYIDAPQESVARQLYDLRDDPGERRNRFATEPDLVARLSRQLAEWRSRHAVEAEAQPVLPSTIDRERLRALGYVDPVPTESAASPRE